MTAEHRCPVCFSNGVLAVRARTDFFCSSPGSYSYRQCAQCHLLWISPQPDPAALRILYERYYGETQIEPTTAELDHGLRSLIRQSILHRELGYPAPAIQSFWLRSVAALSAYLPPVRRRARYGLSLLFPPFRPEGRHLDVGCGLGWLVYLMGVWGWDALGIEFDGGVARNGRKKYGIRILEGSLEQAELEASSLDAITLRHSIEHVHDPRATLTECYRLLRPGGWIGVATPNGFSLCSRLFGEHWRGLTAPWHLHLFSPTALTVLLEETGFRVRQMQTTAVSAHWVYSASRMIRKGSYDSKTPVSKAWWFWALEALLNLWNGDLGEELEVVAERSL